METRIDVFAYHFGMPGGPEDTEARRIVEKAGGREIGAGTFLQTGERDMQFAVDEDKRQRVLDELRAHGFKAEAKRSPPSSTGGDQVPAYPYDG